MTDHLDEAAATAVELAKTLMDAPSVGERMIAAAHLTYLAGLIRGGAVRPAERAVVVDCPTHGLRALLLSGPEVMCGECRIVGPDRKPLGRDDGRPTETGGDPGQYSPWAFQDADPDDHAPIETAGEPSPGEFEDLREKLKAAEILRDVLERAAARYRRRWHQVTDQRDALVRAAKEVLDDGTVIPTPRRDALREVVERVESGADVFSTAARLRRELWAVLDRMPASDDDLIASIRKLKTDSQQCGPHPIELDGLQRRIHALRAAVKDLLDNDGDLLDEKRRSALARTYRESETPAQAAAQAAARLHGE